jgi:hypothetical protein
VHATKIAIPMGRAFSASLSIRNLTSILVSFPACCVGRNADAMVKNCAGEPADWRRN